MRPTIRGSSILVTGGAGFIGSHLVDGLLNEKAKEIVIIDNMFLGNEANIDTAKQQGNVVLYKDDAEINSSLRYIFDRHPIDIVFNAATKALNYSFVNPANAFSTNVNVIINLLELQRMKAFSTLCHFSTSEVYGTAQYEPMDENHPTNPTTTYAAGKHAADIALQSYVKMFDLDAFIVRPFNNYGPRQNSEGYLAGVIPITARRILNDKQPEIHGTGEQTRDFIYVLDTVDAIISLYDMMEPGTSVNISTDGQIAIKDVISKIMKILEYQGDVIFKNERKADVECHNASNAKIRSMIDYQLTSFEKGLQETLDWYKKTYQRYNMIRLIKPYISFAEVEDDFKEIFASGIFTKGKHVAALRQEIAHYTRAKYAFLTTSATTALSTALKILNIKSGDEVIVSDFSFPATANVVEDIGAVPVFADVSLDTFNLLPEELEKKITSKTKSVIFVDAFGNPSGLHAIKEICRKYAIPLIEDAACALGSSQNNEKCGKVADLTCFSFHPRKLLTTGEGGAITVDDVNLAERLEIKLNHGAEIAGDGTQDFVDYGYNFRMSELQAMMARKQLLKLEDIIRHRNEIKESYRKSLEPFGFIVQKINPGVSHNCQSIVFKVPQSMNRDNLITHLRNHEIESTIGTYCLSGGTYYARKYNMIQPNANYLEKNTITLPCYKDIDTSLVTLRIKEFVEKT